MSVEYRSDSREDTVPVTVHAAALDEITRLRAELDRAWKDTERLDKLESLFAASPAWPLVCLETIPGEFKMEACNKYHGDAAGRFTSNSVRSVIDAAITKEKSE